MTRAGCENQEIVSQIAIDQSRIFLSFDIHRLYFGENDFDVLALAKYRANRRGDVGWRERSRRDLVKQRLKQDDNSCGRLP